MHACVQAVRTRALKPIKKSSPSQPGVHGIFSPGSPPVFWPLTRFTGVVHMRRRVMYPRHSFAHSYRGIVPSFAHDHSPIPNDRLTRTHPCNQFKYVVPCRCSRRATRRRTWLYPSLQTVARLEGTPFASSPVLCSGLNESTSRSASGACDDAWFGIFSRVHVDAWSSSTFVRL